MLSCTTRFSARLLGTARRSLAARGAAAAVHTEAKIAELGYTLPEVNPPKGAYVLCTRSGDGKTVYTAGHLPQPADGELVTGKVGADLTREEGHAAVVQILLANGADSEAKVNGWSALAFADANGHADVMELLRSSSSA